MQENTPEIKWEAVHNDDQYEKTEGGLLTQIYSQIIEETKYRDGYLLRITTKEWDIHEDECKNSQVSFTYVPAKNEGKTNETV